MEHDSAIAALVPDAPDEIAGPVAEALANSVAATPEPPDKLHVTITYVGAEGPVDDAAVAAFSEVVAAVVAERPADPIRATVASIEPLGDEGAVVAMLDGPDIDTLHDELQAALDQVDPGNYFTWPHPSFIAHMTVAYGPPPGPEGDESDEAALVATAEGLAGLVGSEVSFSAVAVWAGDDIVATHPFGGGPAEEEEPAVDPTDTVPAEAASARGKLTFDKGRFRFVPATDDRVGQGVEFKGAGKVNADAEGTVVNEDGSWEGVLVIEGLPSGDGRMILEGALEWRELPLPLMVMFRNPDSGAGGHAGAELAGRIDSLERREGGVIWGAGKLDLESAAGAEAARLMAGKFMRGVSVDLDNVIVDFENTPPDDAEIEDILTFDPGMMLVSSGRVMGATMTVFPAFQEAQIVLLSSATGAGFADEPCNCGAKAFGGMIDTQATPAADGDKPCPCEGEEGCECDEDDALVASAGSPLDGAQVRIWTPYDETSGALVASAGATTGLPPVPHTPPAAWFERRDLAGPTKLRVTGDGQVYGHVAVWGTCHIGFGDRCVPVPRTGNDYADFRGGSTLTQEGRLINTGPLLVDTVHPDLRMRASDAMAFYAHTGCAVADVAVYEDKYGIQVAGACRSGVTYDQMRAMRGSDVSPDWRPMRQYGGRREVVAMLFVNNSGFKVRDHQSDGHELPALVASAGVDVKTLVAEGLRGHVQPGKVAAQIDLSDGSVGAMVGGRRPSGGGRDQAMATLLAMIRRQQAQIDELAAQVRPIRRRHAAARFSSGRTRGAPADV